MRVGDNPVMAAGLVMFLAVNLLTAFASTWPTGEALMGVDLMAEARMAELAKERTPTGRVSERMRTERILTIVFVENWTTTTRNGGPAV